MNTSKPLADALRPETLDDVVGQLHILGKNGLLRRIIERGTIPNLIFYGPSGTGKTTVANIIAAQTHRAFRKLNATTATTADIRDVIEQRDTLLAPNGVLLYLDEIQYFNKKQQQTLLEYIEDGSIHLIASTTENPYFYVYGAILSRSTVFEFKPVAKEEIAKAIRRAISVLEQQNAVKCEIYGDTVMQIALSCGGDVRKALNAVEILFHSAEVAGNIVKINAEDAELIAQRSAMRYDKDGDQHYDVLSALHKSLRGSDTDAALHYLARLLEAGDIISACRRILCAACEDIGVAYPLAIPLVKACCDAARELGMPEARLPLSDAVILLTTAPKSNSALAIDAALADVRAGKIGDVPRNLQNVHADGADIAPELRGVQGYLYPHDYPNNWIPQQYLPDVLKDAKYYTPGNNKLEQTAKDYWERIKGGV